MVLFSFWLILGEGMGGNNPLSISDALHDLQDLNYRPKTPKTTLAYKLRSRWWEDSSLFPTSWMPCLAMIWGPITVYYYRRWEIDWRQTPSQSPQSTVSPTLGALCLNYKDEAQLLSPSQEWLQLDSNLVRPKGSIPRQSIFDATVSPNPNTTPWPRSVFSACAISGHRHAGSGLSEASECFRLMCAKLEVYYVFIWRPRKEHKLLNTPWEYLCSVWQNCEVHD